MVFNAEDISYCSNVHAGESVEAIVNNLSQYIQPVCKNRGLAKMAAGLWISASAARDLGDDTVLNQFKLALYENNLTLTSINGFPYGDFHQENVKTDVYLPDWSDPERLQYSKNLADILAACLPKDQDTGTISTLPLGYKAYWSEKKQKAAIFHLRELTAYLEQLKKSSGKRILFCLEMEPDCVLESTPELIHFFVNDLRPKIEFCDYLAVCYDVCHQAVMFEDLYLSLTQIVNAGITIGKIQLSSALQAIFTNNELDGNDSLLELLRYFCEPKYLHQVKCKGSNGRLIHINDLTSALHARGLQDENLDGDWRIHFHVPIDTCHLVHPSLKTTREDLLRVFDFLQDNQAVRPYLEVETYSWNVLPVTLRPKNDEGLIIGITNELNWVESELLKRALINSDSNRGIPSKQEPLV